MGVVDLVVLQLIHEGTGSILMETKHTIKGQEKQMDWLPAIKLRPHENQFSAAHRILEKDLRIDDDYINFRPNEVKIVEEEKDSETYVGLRSKYRKRIITADARGIVPSSSQPCTPKLGFLGGVDHSSWRFSCCCRDSN